MSGQKLKLLEAKRALYYVQITNTFNLTPKLRDEKSYRSFMSQARCVDKMRDEFVAIVDEINLINLELDPAYAVNYQTVTAFDDLFFFIKETYDQVLEQKASQTSSAPPVVKSEHSIKIPRIELPIFDGEIQNFPFFYETFKRVIHENKNLTDSERVHYLTTHLTEKAKTICAGIIPSAENYDIIWQALLDKYRDDRALATSYLNQLFSLKNINGPSANNLEKFIDQYAATISALKQLKIENLSDFIFVHLGLKLIDSDTAKCFEASIRGQSDMPKYEEFIKFVREQVKILYRTSQQPGFTKSDNPRSLASASVRAAITRAPAPRALITTQKTPAPAAKCKLCQGSAHKHIYECKQFANLSPLDKFKFVKESRFCVNCLSSQHTAFNCSSKQACRRCNLKHHTLLHFERELPRKFNSTAMAAVSDETEIQEVLESLETEEEPYTDVPSPVEESPEVSFCTLSSAKLDTKPVTQVLATAKIHATGRNGRDVTIRCLLDPGSQRHYVTSKCCSKLGLQIKSSSPVTVKGIGGSSQIVKGETAVSFKSRSNHGPRFNIQALVLNQITNDLPTCQIDTKFLDNLKSIPLADDSWGTPGEIDLLIGVSLFVEMLRPGKIEGQPGCPDALETVLGYVVLGDAPTASKSTNTVSFHSIGTCEVESLVRRFWELDEVDLKPILSVDDKTCEDLYKETTTRDSTGRYEVALPFKSNPSILGNSFDIAKRRFLYLERKFERQPLLKVAYDEVIKDYLDKSYLSPVKTIDASTHSFYIPHHAVLREDKATTKVRPVLDASAKSSSGFSLNDVLHTGPNLQGDLFTILLNMRLFPIAISADVRQMYLRIGVREQDRCFQRVLYRINPGDENFSEHSDNFSADSSIQTLEFNRVAFGLKCSPFLALRTVAQLAQDEGHRFPKAKEIVQRDLYMDDIASSLMNSEQATTASQELIDLFQAGGFQLAKWSSNCREILEQIPEDYRLSKNVEFNKDDTLKILGLCWRPQDDIFTFNVTSDERPCSKRHILSSIARLFDVLGLVAPVILYAKLLIKDLWTAKIDWDEIPPQRIIRLWNQFQTELPQIAQMQFPRHVGVVEGCSVCILGFGDASEKAYGGVVYVYVCTPQGETKVMLVCAKSKVAPLKTVSLARLELCAALLLSKLIRKVYETYHSRYPIHSILAFSDSTVALSWIHSSPHRWHTFVANRVSKLQENLKSDHFFHIHGNENPSDCLSRGLTPAQLVNHPLWLHGPPWINNPINEWPIKPFVSNDSLDMPELKPVSLVTTTPEEPFLCSLARKFSSWTKFLHTLCYIFKFSKRLPSGSITEFDLKFVEQKIVTSVQAVHFDTEISNLKKGNPCSAAILKLNPFLDGDGILRVGGRLSNSDENFDYKHPVLLPGRDYVVEMLIRHYHCRNLHTGPGLLMSVLRTKYWLLAARRAIRSVITKCNICFRFKPQPGLPMMADLPEPRVKEVSKAFIHTGCDFAGPFFVTPYRGRGIKSRKAYICLFTCLTTRAVHIELASELSTACFLAALKRFLARRGPVQCFYTDHGTNFIGTRSYLRDLYKFLEEDYKEVWKNELADNSIQWKLIPPNAPHFGGCWESNIKCIKSHLYKVIGLQTLTFEELSTVLAQIESLLNSRPLTVLSPDPSEPTALTPAHFLHSAPLKFLPTVDVSDSNAHLLSRYELLDKLVQSFWKRWREEYLHTLQIRQKWNTPTLPVKEGMVVVVMQDNTMPLLWPLGVIVQTFKGRDDVIRVAMVTTKSGTYKRPVVKLCPLPTQ